MKNNRFLNMAYLMEFLNSRINGSSKEVENILTEFDNISYTKKINGKGTISSQTIKYNIKEYMNKEELLISKKIKSDKKVITNSDPFIYSDEDVLGFMKTEKSNKKDKTDKTVKRKSNLLMSHLTQIDNNKVQKEYCNCKCENNENMPYKVETYSGLFTGIANMNIDKISKFTISDEEEYKDYLIKNEQNYKENDIIISKEEKFNRIKVTLEGLRYLSMANNQSNYLTDTTPKIIILGEYSWGNNVFQGVLDKTGVNIEALKETLEENERFRQSPIYIGVSNRVYNTQLKNLKEKLRNELINYDFLYIDTVGKAFDKYLDYLKESLLQ